MVAKCQLAAISDLYPIWKQNSSEILETSYQEAHILFILPLSVVYSFFFCIEKAPRSLEEESACFGSCGCQFQPNK